MDYDNPHTILPVKGGATSFAYCITGSDQQYMATADNHGKIEVHAYCLASIRTKSAFYYYCVHIYACAERTAHNLILVYFESDF